VIGDEIMEQVTVVPPAIVDRYRAAMGYDVIELNEARAICEMRISRKRNKAKAARKARRAQR
jgi:hypothetical protein